MSRRTTSSQRELGSATLSISEILDLFIQRARELEQTRLIKNKPDLNWSMNFNSEGEASFTSQEPDEEDVRSFLLTFRQFVSDNEPIHLYRMHNLLYQRLTDEDLKKYLVDARGALKFAEQGSGITVVHNDVEVTPERLLDLWINGVYFHNDQDKRQVLEDLLLHPALMARHRFLSFMLKATQIIFYIGNLINHARREGLIDEEDVS